MKNTKQVEGRRDLNYTDFNDLLADIERVVAEPHEVIGNWTAGEIIDHVAKPIPWAMDGYDPELLAAVPWYFKVFGPLMKKSFLAQKPPPAGIKPPTKMMAFFEPERGVSVETAMQRLRDAVTRWPESDTIPKNPLIGSMTKAEWERFLTNHASLHFSFIVPA
ncbi:MAG: DUF1569 domain-containing protein [Planctomycetota bacterium]